MTLSSQQTKAFSPFLKGALFGLTCAFIWAGWILITSTATKGRHLSIYDITALRFSVVGLFFLPVVLKRGFHIGRHGWLGILIMSFGAGPPYILLAANGMSCANICQVGGLLPGTMPLFTAILSVIVLRERITLLRVFGLFLIIFGVFVLTGFNPFAFNADFLMYYLSLLAASLAWSCFTVSMRYWKVNPVHAAALVSVISAAIYLPIYFFYLEPTVTQAPLNEILLQLFYQGVMAAIVGLILYSKAVEILGAARGAVFVAMVPVLATLMGIPFMGEWPSFFEWGAILTLTFGVLLATGAVFSWKQALGSVSQIRRKI